MKGACTFEKKIVKKNFSRHAGNYDEYAGVQKVTARALIDEIKGKGFSRVLDAGCGTGLYTLLLRKKFPQAFITALDISGAMLDIARAKPGLSGVTFIEADADGFRPGGKFDLITSNAALHWFRDLEGFLKSCKNSLSEKGEILFSVFGPNTFFELNSLFKRFFPGKPGLTSSSFYTSETLKDFFKRTFRKVSIREAVYFEVYPGLLDLLKAVKLTGTRGLGFDLKRVWVPDFIQRVEEAYIARFRAVKVTYQVFYIKALR